MGDNGVADRYCVESTVTCDGNTGIVEGADAPVAVVDVDADAINANDSMDGTGISRGRTADASRPSLIAGGCGGVGAVCRGAGVVAALY